MDRSKFTEEQLRAIDAGYGNLLISAAAGSGKTTVMIGRIINLLSQTKPSLDRMLICTFTRASAADMREKLRKSLQEELASGETWAETQLELLSRADICTIDSWCQKLVRSYFYEVGVDPAFEILDEKNQKALLNQAIEEVLQDRRERGSEVFFALDEALRKKRNDEPLKEMIASVYLFSQTQTSAEDFLNRATDCYDGGYVAIAKQFFDRRRAGCAKKLAHVIETAAQYGVKDEGLNKWTDAYNAAMEDDCTLIPKTMSYGKMEPKAKQFAKAAIGDLRELFKMESDALNGGAVNAEMARELVDIVKDVTACYRRIKDRRGELDYADIEYLADRLLQYPSILEEVKAKTEWVFVDEYQDVNPLQDRLLQTLKNPERGNLFFVGDLKQSIYAFRNCDPDIFASIYATPQAYGFCEPIDFTRNFRCGRAIIRFVNEVFCEHMTEEFGCVDYVRHQLKEGKNKEDGGNGEGEVRAMIFRPSKEEKLVERDYDLFDGADESENNDLFAAAIVADIAKRIAEEKERNGEVALSDYAVLTRARTPIVAKIRDKLKASGIPVGMEAELYYACKPSVSFLLQILRFIANHEDEIAFVGVCMDPVFGLSPDEILKIKAQNPSYSLVRSACEYVRNAADATAEKLRRVFDLIDEFDQRVSVLSVGELLGEIVARLDYFTVVLRRYGAEDSQLLSDFLDMVNDSVAADSVSEFLDYVDEKGNSLKTAPVGDCVRIMTVHASKGLEFLHVYLVGTEKSKNDRSSNCLLNRQLGVALKTVDEDERAWTDNPFFTFAKEMKSKQDNESELRLLYVALTRAIRSLTVCATVDVAKSESFYDGYPKQGNTFFAWMSSAIHTNGYEVIEEEACLQAEEEILKPIKAGRPSDRKTFGKGDDALIAALNARFAKVDEAIARSGDDKIKTTVTGEAKRIAETEEGELPIIGDLSAIFSIDEERSLSATERGNAYHKVMEQFDFVDYEAEKANIEKSGMAEWKWVNEQTVKAAFEAIKPICAGGKLYKEKSFVKNWKGALLQGVIDLLVIKEGKATVVDYKTTSVVNLKREQTQREYAAQTGLYASAVRDVLGIEVERVCLYSFEAGAFLEYPIAKDQDWEDVSLYPIE